MVMTNEKILSPSQKLVLEQMAGLPNHNQTIDYSKMIKDGVKRKVSRLSSNKRNNREIASPRVIKSRESSMDPNLILKNQNRSEGSTRVNNFLRKTVEAQNKAQ